MQPSWQKIIKLINRSSGVPSIDSIFLKISGGRSAVLEPEMFVQPQYLSKAIQLAVQTVQQEYEVAGQGNVLTTQRAESLVKEKLKLFFDNFMSQFASFTTEQAGHHGLYDSEQEFANDYQSIWADVEVGFSSLYPSIAAESGMAMDQLQQQQSQAAPQEQMVPVEINDVGGYDEAGQEKDVRHSVVQFPKRIVDLVTSIAEKQFSDTVLGVENPATGERMLDWFQSTLAFPDMEGKYPEIYENPEYMKLYNQVMRNIRQEYQRDPEMQEEYQQLLKNEAFLQGQMENTTGNADLDGASQEPYSTLNLAALYTQSFLGTPEDKRYHEEEVRKPIEDIIDRLPSVFKDTATKGEGGADGRIRFLLDAASHYNPSAPRKAPGLGEADAARYNQDLQKVFDFVSSKGIVFSQASGQRAWGADNQRKILGDNNQNIAEAGNLVIDLIKNKSPLIRQYVIGRLRSILFSRFNQGVEPGEKPMSGLTMLAEDGREVEIPGANTINDRLRKDLIGDAAKGTTLDPHTAQKIFRQRQQAVTKWVVYSNSFARMSRDFAQYMSGKLQTDPSWKTKGGFEGKFDEPMYDKQLEDIGAKDLLYEAKRLQQEIRRDPDNPENEAKNQRIEEITKQLQSTSGKGKKNEGTVGDRFEAVRNRHFVSQAKTVMFLDSIANYILTSLSEKLTPDNLARMQQTNAQELRRMETLGLKLKMDNGKVVGLDLDRDYIDFGALIGAEGLVEIVQDFFNRRQQLIDDPEVSDVLKPRNFYRDESSGRESAYFPGDTEFEKRYREDAGIGTKDIGQSYYTSLHYFLDYIGDWLVDASSGIPTQRYNPWQVKSFLSAISLDISNWHYGILSSEKTSPEEKTEAAKAFFNTVNKQSNRGKIDDRYIYPFERHMNDGGAFANQLRSLPPVSSSAQDKKNKPDIVLRKFDEMLQSGQSEIALEIAKEIGWSYIRNRGEMGWDKWKAFLDAQEHPSMAEKRKARNLLIDQLFKHAEIKNKIGKFGSTDSIDDIIKQTVDTILCLI